MALPVAIQLYSLRDEMEKDFVGTLKLVKELGYDGVEFAGLFGKSAEEVKAILDEIGLVPVSAHIAIDEMLCDGGVYMVIRKYAEIGCKYFAIPFLSEERRPGNARWEETIAMLRYAAEVAKKFGMIMLYHNHDFEFTAKLDGKRHLDILYDSIPADKFQSELDTCWVNIGGEVPAEYIVNNFTGRAPVVHLKDFYMTGSLPAHLYELIGVDEEEAEAEEATFEFRPIGHGMQDMPAILAAAVKAGAKWVVVEQDNPTEGMTPVECATKSIAYVKGQNW